MSAVGISLFGAECGTLDHVSAKGYGNRSVFDSGGNYPVKKRRNRLRTRVGGDIPVRCRCSEKTVADCAAHQIHRKTGAGEK